MTSWAISQLASYGEWAWALFIAVAFVAACFVRVRGILLGHLLVAIAVVTLDVRWVRTEMGKPGWDGQPDQDIVFAIGVLLRVVLINGVLLPVSMVGLWLRPEWVYRKKQWKGPGQVREVVEIPGVAARDMGREIPDGYSSLSYWRSGVFWGFAILAGFVTLVGCGFVILIFGTRMNDLEAIVADVAQLLLATSIGYACGRRQFKLRQPKKRGFPVIMKEGGEETRNEYCDDAHGD
jgi:hypothetical protein